MAIHAEASDLSTATTELGITQRRVAELFGVKPRSVRRWQNGERHIPCGVSIVVKLLVMGVVTVTQIEQATVPARTTGNGSAKPRLPTPLLDELVPEQSALTRTEAATSGTAAAQVFALTPDACRWPSGDPGSPDFHFCGSPVAKRPYCEHHRALAYMASPTRSLRRTTPFHFSAKRY